MAVMLHGGDAVTSDFDLVFSKERDNLDRLVAALQDIGARPVRSGDEQPFELDLSIVLAPFMHLKSEAGLIDLINRLPNIESFEDLFDRSLAVEVDGVEIRIASIDDLIRLKTGTNRERDRVHIRVLESIKAEFDI